MSLTFCINENAVRDSWACNIALYAVCQCPAFRAILALISQERPISAPRPL
jgi:hypothetical protein